MNSPTIEQLQKIINAAEEVITALDGTNEDIHRDSSSKMCEAWDYLNDRAAPPKVVKQLAEIALAALTAEPAGYIGIRALSESKVWDEVKPAFCLKGSVKTFYSTPPAASMNYPVIPEGWILMPRKLTAENGAKAALSGDFAEHKVINCPECFGDDECESCDGSGLIKFEVTVSWSTIKAIWEKGADHFAAAPAPGGDDV